MVLPLQENDKDRDFFLYFCHSDDGHLLVFFWIRKKPFVISLTRLGWITSLGSAIGVLLALIAFSLGA